MELLPFVLLLGFAACTPPKVDTTNAGDSIGLDTSNPDTADTETRADTDETAQVDTGDVPDEWSVHRRSRTQDEDGAWQVNEWTETWEPSETVILVIDMWAGYNSVSATHNVNLLAPLMNEAFADARSRGVRVIWAPANGGTSSYEDTPQRHMMEDAPYSELPIPWTWWYPEPWEYDNFALLEEGHSESGDPDNTDFRQTDALTIELGDGISEDLQEMWNWFIDNHIQHVILTGMYTNFCILGRPWGLRALDAAGMDAVVVRDLTDSQGSVRQALLHVARPDHGPLHRAHRALLGLDDPCGRPPRHAHGGAVTPSGRDLRRRRCILRALRGIPVGQRRLQPERRWPRLPGRHLHPC